MARSRLFHVIGASRDDVRAFLAALGEPPYRADQLLRWVYHLGAQDFAAMTNLPKPTRAALAEHAALHATHVADIRTGRDGTEKLLLGLGDGETVETVVIPEGGRRTVCISTQVGCAVGCVFCASGLGGLVRNLTAGEIVEQVLHARRRVRAAGSAAEAGVTNVVVMGMGEPLANYDALVKALHILTAPWGLDLTPRRVTVSTVGLPDRMRRLAADGPGVKLALSLHAANDRIRRRLVPGARPASEVVAAARRYQRQTGQELTFEVVLVRGVNDSADDARGVAELARGLRVLVNVLAVNPVPGLPWEAPGEARVRRFVAALRGQGVNVQVRRRRGDDIDAACGQLRRRAGAS